MQIVEVSVTGVRSAVITLRHPGTPLQFMIFPMVHLGSPDFYAAVAGRLACCHEIVAEGVAGLPIFAQALTLAYRLPARSRHLGLVVQHLDYAAIGVPVIRPDLTARRARLAWRAVPVIQRLAVVCLVPAFALAFWLFGTRQVLARYLRQEDLPDHVDEQMRQAAPELVKMLVDDRDAMLIEALNSLHQTRSSEPITVAVVYGAAHVPAVIRALYAHHGYRPSAAEWLTVFDF